ncbi:MAG: hypothetical protein RIC89_08210, partial [Pseudomonadales bacterium]
MKTLVKLVFVVALAALSSTVLAQQFTPAEGRSEGEIQALDFANSTLIIQGSRLSIDQAANVEIGGSYGAFTMLREGMMVEYWYRRHQDGSREIFELRELIH